jgi:hypothetical protein
MALLINFVSFSFLAKISEAVKTPVVVQKKAGAEDSKEDELDEEEVAKVSV